jgi:hypothetical protein
MKLSALFAACRHLINEVGRTTLVPVSQYNLRVEEICYQDGFGRIRRRDRFCEAIKLSAFNMFRRQVIRRVCVRGNLWRRQPKGHKFELLLGCFLVVT